MKKTEWQLYWEEKYREEHEFAYTNKYFNEQEIVDYIEPIEVINKNISEILVEFSKISVVFSKYSFEEIMFYGINNLLDGYELQTNKESTYSNPVPIKKVNVAYIIINFDMDGELSANYIYIKNDVHYALSIRHDNPTKLSYFSDDNI